MAAALEAEAEADDDDEDEPDDATRTSPRTATPTSDDKPRAVAADAAAAAAGPQVGGGGPLEGTFDHGDEGYGLWLDPAVQDDPVYAEHWAGHRPVDGHGRGRPHRDPRVGGDADDD